MKKEFKANTKKEINQFQAFYLIMKKIEKTGLIPMWMDEDGGKFDWEEIFPYHYNLLIFPVYPLRLDQYYMTSINPYMLVTMPKISLNAYIKEFVKKCNIKEKFN